MSWTGNMLRIFFAVAAASLAAMSWGAGDAHALERGQCASPQALSDELLQEGESNPFTFAATMETFSVDVADGGTTAMLAQFIAANQDRSRFYILTGDVPLGEPATKFCVTGIGRDLEINDYRQDRAPQVTRYVFDQQDARRQCGAIREELGNIICADRETILKRANDKDGHRLALQGIFLSKSGIDAGLFTLVASPDGKKGYATMTTADEGATTVLESGISFSLTPPLIESLDEAGNPPR